MAYVPVATQTTEPIESQSVKSAALEFRTLKTFTSQLQITQSSFSAQLATILAGIAGGTNSAALAANLAASGGSNLIGFIHGGVGAVYRTVQDRFRDLTSVVDYGADSSGVLDCAAAVAAATVAKREVAFPSGTWAAAATPAITGNTSLVSQAGATFSGAGMAALGFAAGAHQQRIQFNTVGTDFATSYFRRNANHAGGAAGFVSSCVRVETYVSNAAATNYEWAFVAKVDNSATGGQNVAGYFQGIKRSTGPTWGITAEAIDATGTANPATGLVAAEIDVRANGTDSLNQRIGIDVVITRQYVAGVLAGAAMQAGYGVRVQNGGDGVNSVVTTAFGVTANSVVGVDTSQAVISQAAFKMAVNQPIAFNAGATRKLFHNGGGWLFADAANNPLAAIADSGAYSVGANQVVGGRDTGYAAMTGATNKATVYDTATVTLAQLAGRMMALQASLTLHGLIGA